MKEIYRWISISGRLSHVFADHRFKEAGINLNSSHRPFIIHICKEPGITRDQLKSRIYIHPSNITRALEFLEKEGYIWKEPSPSDKRTCFLYPTEKAKKAYVMIEEVIEEWEEKVTKKLSKEERELFERLIQKVGESSTEEFF